MSEVFFDDLGIRRPDHFLGAGSDSHANQTGRVMTAFEPLACDLTPDVVVVLPAHPRVDSRLPGAGLSASVRIIPPLGHLDFIAVEVRAAREVIAAPPPPPRWQALWDSQAGQRIAAALVEGHDADGQRPSSLATSSFTGDIDESD